MNISSHQKLIPEYRQTFQNAWPFKHIVIDNFLEEELIEQVLSDFPHPDRMDTHGSNKKVLLGWQISPLSENYVSKPSLDYLFEYLKSEKLREIIGEIAGCSKQIVCDPDYHGSGLLLAPTGGIHKIHADRTFHFNSAVYPRLVFLLYFNKNCFN